MIENRPDWCVSRQRAWGIPITVFYCSGCKQPLVNQETIEHVARLFEEKGADVWFEEEADHLLPKGTHCPQCGGKEFTKETDILDVWFDSGVSHAAVLEKRSDLEFPASLYLEGSDQHRGWFHSSLLTSVGTRGCAPYRIGPDPRVCRGWRGQEDVQVGGKCDCPGRSDRAIGGRCIEALGRGRGLQR